MKSLLGSIIESSKRAIASYPFRQNQSEEMKLLAEQMINKGYYDSARELIIHFLHPDDVNQIVGKLPSSLLSTALEVISNLQDSYEQTELEVNLLVALATNEHRQRGHLPEYVTKWLEESLMTNPSRIHPDLISLTVSARIPFV
ncbi:MAG: hypothetical protein R3C14_14075 [Caldilineaceae bacterium]